MGNNQCPQCTNQFSGILERLNRSVFNMDIMDGLSGVAILGMSIGVIYSLYLRDPSQSWDKNLVATVENEELAYKILEWLHEYRSKTRYGYNTPL